MPLQYIDNLAFSRWPHPILHIQAHDEPAIPGNESMKTSGMHIQTRHLYLGGKGNLASLTPVAFSCSVRAHRSVQNLPRERHSQTARGTWYSVPHSCFIRRAVTLQQKHDGRAFSNLPEERKCHAAHNLSKYRYECLSQKSCLSTCHRSIRIGEK